MAQLYREQGVTDVSNQVTTSEANFTKTTINPIRQTLNNISDYENQQAQKFERKANESLELYERGMQNLTSQSMKELYEANKTNPQALQKEFEKLSSDIIDTIPDENTRIRVKSNFLLDSQTYVNGAIKNLETLQKKKMQQDIEMSMINYNELYGQSFRNILNDPTNGNNVSDFNRFKSNIESLLSLKDENGIYRFSPEKQKTIRDGMKKSLYNGFKDYFDDLSSEEKKQMYDNFQDGKYKNMFDSSMYGDLKRYTEDSYAKDIDRQIKERKLMGKVAYVDWLNDKGSETKFNAMLESNPELSDKTKESLREQFMNTPEQKIKEGYVDITEAVEDVDNLINTKFNTQDEQYIKYAEVVSKINNTKGDDEDMDLLGINDEKRKELVSSLVNTLRDEDLKNYWSDEISPFIQESIGWSLKEVPLREQRLMGMKANGYVEDDPNRESPVRMSPFTMIKPIMGFMANTINTERKKRNNAIRETVSQGIEAQLGYLIEAGQAKAMGDEQAYNDNIRKASESKQEMQFKVLNKLYPVINRDVFNLAKDGKKPTIEIRGKLYHVESVTPSVVLESIMD